MMVRGGVNASFDKPYARSYLSDKDDTASTKPYSDAQTTNRRSGEPEGFGDKSPKRFKKALKEANAGNIRSFPRGQYNPAVGQKTRMVPGETNHPYNSPMSGNTDRAAENKKTVFSTDRSTVPTLFMIGPKIKGPERVQNLLTNLVQALSGVGISQPDILETETARNEVPEYYFVYQTSNKTRDQDHQKVLNVFQHALETGSIKHSDRGSDSAM